MENKMNFKNLFLIKFISLITLILISNPVMSGPSAAAEAAAANDVKNEIGVAIDASNNEVFVNLVKEYAKDIGVDISSDDLKACAAGSGCEAVFQAIIKNLAKLLTPEFRMINAIHMLRPDQVKFSKSQVQNLSAILLAAK